MKCNHHTIDANRINYDETTPHKSSLIASFHVCYMRDDAFSRVVGSHRCDMMRVKFVIYVQIEIIIICDVYWIVLLHYLVDARSQESYQYN